MAIIFENIHTGETYAYSQELEGKYYGSKLTAAVNSSNLGANADRGQDYGLRLKAEQQVIIEEWEQESEMIDKVSSFTKVPVDGLTHTEFLMYMLHMQEAGKSATRTEISERRAAQADYEARVEALKAKKNPAPVPAFVAPSGVLSGVDEQEQETRAKLDSTPKKK